MPMIAEFLLTPFLMAWPCPGLYGKSALAAEKEMKGQAGEWRTPLIPHDLTLIFSCNSSTRPVFANEIPISDVPVLLLFPMRTAATSTPVPAASLCTRLR